MQVSRSLVMPFGPSVLDQAICRYQPHTAAPGAFCARALALAFPRPGAHP